MSDEDTTNTQPEVLENDNEEDQKELLKGDAIGETLFSESWVLKTLMKLAQEMPKYSLNNREPKSDDDADDEILPMELDEALETDLCLLWDMAADKDVAVCYMKHDIVSLIKCVIDHSSAPRLTEIAVGILGNLSCQQEIGRELVSNTNLMTGVINLLSNNDTQTVIQCVRLLEALLHSLDSLDSVIKNHPSLWERISFILQNSLNEDLLCGTLKLLNYFITQLDNDVECPCEVVLQGLLECQNQLRKDVNSEVEFPNNIVEAFDSLISSLYNLSRKEAMRSEIGEKSQETSQFLEFYLSNILRRIQHRSSEFTSLTTSAVQAVTLFYIVIDTTLCAQLLSLSTRIGCALSRSEKDDQADQYVSDYGEMLGDCFRKLLALFDSERILQMLEPFDARDLNYLFQHASRATPEGLDELITKGRSFQSFNKVTETYNTFTSSANSH